MYESHRSKQERFDNESIFFYGIPHRCTSYLDSCVMAGCYLTENEQRERENKKLHTYIPTYILFYCVLR